MHDRIDNLLHDWFSLIHREANLETGDISPQQALELEDIINRIEKLSVTFISQNQKEGHV